MDETIPSTELFPTDLFRGDSVLVTGGGTGIGKQISLAFAEHGADVAITSRDMDHLEPVVQQITDKGQKGFATTCNVREWDEVTDMTETVIEEMGGISILINNAGANFLTRTRNLSVKGWRSVVQTILDGTAFCTISFGNHMIESGDGGVILSMGATNSERGAPFNAHSGAGKAGVHNLMKSVAAEWAQHGIRANTIAPGVIETEGLAETMTDAAREQMINDIPADRLGDPNDCVPLTLFLASNAASYITGGYYTVDGGQLLAPV